VQAERFADPVKLVPAPDPRPVKVVPYRSPSRVVRRRKPVKVLPYLGVDVL
jgi:hypothetical protein